MHSLQKCDPEPINCQKSVDITKEPAEPDRVRQAEPNQSTIRFKWRLNNLESNKRTSVLTIILSFVVIII